MIVMAMNDCIFCKIIKGDLPSRKLIETDHVIGILDTIPAIEGHCLIIPKRHVKYWNDMTYTETAQVFNAARKVAKRMENTLKSDYVCMFIRGGRVKHTHVVLFPHTTVTNSLGFPSQPLEHQTSIWISYWKSYNKNSCSMHFS